MSKFSLHTSAMQEHPLQIETTIGLQDITNEIFRIANQKEMKILKLKDHLLLGSILAAASSANLVPNLPWHSLNLLTSSMAERALFGSNIFAIASVSEVA